LRATGQLKHTPDSGDKPPIRSNPDTIVGVPAYKARWANLKPSENRAVDRSADRSADRNLGLAIVLVEYRSPLLGAADATEPLFHFVRGRVVRGELDPELPHHRSGPFLAVDRDGQVEMLEQDFS